MTKLFALIFTTQLFLFSWAQAQERSIEWDSQLTETWEPVPDEVIPVINNQPPSDAIVLFNGKDIDSWEGGSKWNLNDGYLTVEPRTGGLSTKKSFGDIQLHIEWRIPEDVDGEGQRRGNSGVFLQGLYEIQILDSYNNATYTNGQAGAVYKQHPPLVNASLPPGEWQSYDIFFEAPIFREDGILAKPAYFTVIHNGVLIQNRAKVKGPTIFRGLPKYKKHPYKLPISLQGSRHKLSFRNIWVREL